MAQWTHTLRKFFQLILSSYARICWEGKGTRVWDGDEAASIGIRVTLQVFSMDPYSWATDSLGYCLQYASGGRGMGIRHVFGFLDDTGRLCFAVDFHHHSKPICATLMKRSTLSIALYINILS